MRILGQNDKKIKMNSTSNDKKNKLLFDLFLDLKIKRRFLEVALRLRISQSYALFHQKLERCSYTMRAVIEL